MQPELPHLFLSCRSPLGSVSELITDPPLPAVTAIVGHKNRSGNDYSTGPGRRDPQAERSLRGNYDSGFLKRPVRDECLLLRYPFLSRHCLSPLSWKHCVPFAAPLATALQAGVSRRRVSFSSARFLRTFFRPRVVVGLRNPVASASPDLPVPLRRVRRFPPKAYDCSWSRPRSGTICCGQSN